MNDSASLYRVATTDRRHRPEVQRDTRGRLPHRGVPRNVSGGPSKILIRALRERTGPYVCRIAKCAERALTHPAGLAIAWESLFAFDLLIFGLTFCKSYRERARFGRDGLVALIVRDGASVRPALPFCRSRRAGAMYFA